MHFIASITLCPSAFSSAPAFAKASAFASTVASAFVETSAYKKAMVDKKASGDKTVEKLRETALTAFTGTAPLVDNRRTYIE